MENLENGEGIPQTTPETVGAESASTEETPDTSPEETLEGYNPDVTKTEEEEPLPDEQEPQAEIAAEEPAVRDTNRSRVSSPIKEEE